MPRALRVFVSTLTLLAVLLAAEWIVTPPVRGQITTARYELTLVKPPSSNAIDTTMPAAEALLWAGVGIEYQRFAGAVNGAYGDYTWELNDEPPGMVIESPGAGETCGPSYQTDYGTVTHVDCGLISGWTPANASDDHTIEVCVTDTEETQRCRSFTINAIDTGSRIYVVDGDNGQYRSGNGTAYGEASNCSGDCGTGSLSDPWKTIEDCFDGSSVSNGGVAGSICYFKPRAGGAAYTIPFATGIVSNTASCDPLPDPEVNLNSAGRFSSIMGFPGGDRPIIDLQFDGAWTAETPCTETNSAAKFNITSPGTFDYVHYKNGHYMFLEITSSSEFWAPTVTRNIFDTMGPPGSGGSNSAAVMFNTSGLNGSVNSDCTSSPLRAAFGAIVAHNQFINLSSESVKIYSWCQGVLEHNTVTNPVTKHTDGQFALKGGISELSDFRFNICRGVKGTCFGGNNAGFQDNTIRQNLIVMDPENFDTGEAPNCVMYGQDWTSQAVLGPMYIEHNNCKNGRIWVRGTSTAVAPTGSASNVADEPVYINNNALENGDGGQVDPYLCVGNVRSTTPDEWGACTISGSSVTLALVNTDNNLGGASGVLDADGDLVNEAHVGVYGYQQAAGGGAPDPTPSRAPVRGIRFGALFESLFDALFDPFGTRGLRLAQ